MTLKNILITGSKGFIGKNLKKQLLKSKEINLFEIDFENHLVKVTKGQRVKTVEELEQLMPFNLTPEQLAIASHNNNTS